MITKERIKRTKMHLLRQVEQIRDHIKRVQAISESDFLDRWNGKIVNRRIYVPMARAYGCEEMQLRSGGTIFPKASFTFEYMPAPLTGKGVPQLQVNVCEGWGAFGIPLICNYDYDYKLDAKATREGWEKILELRQEWADERERASKLVSYAASEYNKIETKAVKLVDLLGIGPKGLAITTLCAFGGDIYDRINPFRWHENKPEVE